MRRTGETIRGDAEAVREELRLQHSLADSKIRDVDEVGNPMEVSSTRESRAALRQVKTLGRRAVRSACDRTDKAREGMEDTVSGEYRTARRSKKPRRGPTPRRHPQGSLAKPQALGGTPSRVTSLVGGAGFRELDSNSKEVAVLERAYGTARRSKASKG
jgi:hypothetical protein